MDKDQTTSTYNEIYPNNSYNIINYVFNSISILCSFLILTTIATLRIKGIDYSNRISLRLIMYISIAEIFFSISQVSCINFS